jgi:hypothetical protein
MMYADIHTLPSKIIDVIPHQKNPQTKENLIQLLVHLHESMRRIV